jgi:hypothetical protein
MSQIHARFNLQEVARVRCSVYKNQTYESAEGVRVKMNPVHGEPFGTATPGGELMMIIVNPKAVSVFNDAPIGQEFDFLISPVEQST